MLPKTHIMLGLIFSLALFFILDLNLLSLLIIFFSSFLIDTDHYFYGVYKTKTLNIKKIYSYFVEHRIKWRKLSYKQKLKTKFPILIFHGFEFFLILFIISFFSKFFLLIFVGASFHLFTDYMDILVSKDPIFIKLSVAYILLTNKNKKEL